MNLQKLAALAAMTVAVALAQPSARQKRQVTNVEVERVHKSAILIDTHNDITSATVDGVDIGVPNAERHTDIARMKKGGMAAQFFAVFVAASYVQGNRSAHRALDMIDTVKEDIVRKYPSAFSFATSSDDIRRAHKEGKIAALMGIEGGHAIEDDLRLLRQFYDLGIRYMTLTHSNDNGWAGSSGSLQNKGLTDFGKEVVREMNRLGMMVDISHVSDQTFADALITSKAPIFASHSSCRAISPVPRNMTDAMITAMARRGGVIQINFDCSYLNPEVAKASAARNKELAPKLARLREQYANDTKGLRSAMRELRSQMNVGPRATLADVVKHINHVVKIAGIDAVGLGSDFDGVFCVPENLDSVDKWPNLTRALLEEGYTGAEIRKIYGENLLRFMAQVEKTAKDLRSKPLPAGHGSASQ